jgi:enoyl-[acyl-carrier protein] reductase II
MALIPQVVDAVDIPVLGAGSIVDGRGLAAALSLGAQGAWMGTRFIASHEARAAEAYKKQIGETRSEDTIVTRCYSGKPMRVISNPHVELKERTPGAIKRFPEQMYASMQEGVMAALGGATDGIEPDRHCMPCGQGAGGIDDILSCEEIIENTMTEAQSVLSRLGVLAG